jgi:cell division septation protein DedD
MAGNRPARERFEFSLDARQVAAVILGSLGALGLAFFLGHTLGQRVTERPAAVVRAPAVPAPADPLAVLDQAPRPDGGEVPAQLSFHETLTSARPPQDKLPPAPKAAGAMPSEPRGSPVAAALPPPAPSPSGPVAAVALAPAAAKATSTPADSPLPKPVVAVPPPAKPGVAATSAPAPQRVAPAGKGAWVVQVGSTQDRTEAERIAARFTTRGARVVAADVPGKGRWYRVRLGSFETREAADRYLRDLERGTGAKGFVATAN